MRVNFILPHAGQAEGIRNLANYAERLHLRGHRVQVVSLPEHGPHVADRIRSLLQGHDNPVGRRPQVSPFDGMTVPHHVVHRHRPIVDSDVPDADIVLATFWKTADWVAALAPSKGAKAFLIQGYETSPGRHDPAIDRAWQLPLRKIVVSTWLADFAQQRFGDAEVHLVPNGIDLDRLQVPPRGKQAVPTVGLCYDTLHQKGLDGALTALKRVRSRFPNLRVVAFGAGPVVPHLPLPPGAAYHDRPPQAARRDLYAQCDVWLCASRREGFHLTPLEAMACRCPVVSTRVGGPLDTVIDGDNGFLVEVDDVMALGERLTRILALDDRNWRRMSESASRTAGRYGWDDATDLLESALQQIAGLQLPAADTNQRCTQGVEQFVCGPRHRAAELSGVMT